MWFCFVQVFVTFLLLKDVCPTKEDTEVDRDDEFVNVVGGAFAVNLVTVFKPECSVFCRPFQKKDWKDNLYPGAFWHLWNTLLCIFLSSTFILNLSFGFAFGQSCREQVVLKDYFVKFLWVSAWSFWGTSFSLKQSLVSLNLRSQALILRSVLSLHRLILVIEWSIQTSDAIPEE